MKILTLRKAVFDSGLRVFVAGLSWDLGPFLEGEFQTPWPDRNKVQRESE